MGGAVDFSSGGYVVTRFYRSREGNVGLEAEIGPGNSIPEFSDVLIFISISLGLSICLLFRLLVYSSLTDVHTHLIYIEESITPLAVVVALLHTVWISLDQSCM